MVIDFGEMESERDFEQPKNNSHLLRHPFCSILRPRPGVAVPLVLLQKSCQAIMLLGLLCGLLHDLGVKKESGVEEGECHDEAMRRGG